MMQNMNLSPCFFNFWYFLFCYNLTFREWFDKDQPRDRRDQKFRYDIDTDTFSGSESILIPILEVGLNRDRYWYWYQENVPGLILIPRLYLIRILLKPYKKYPSLWIDTGTDTETQKRPRTRPILIPKGLVSVFSIRYRYSRLSLDQPGCSAEIFLDHNFFDLAESTTYGD